MSILCYVTFNDRGSELKGVFGEWGPMFSPESSALARSAASQWGPRPPVRARRQLPAQLSALTPTPPPPPSPPLARQISSSRLNRFFYFISLSSGDQDPPPLLTVSPSGAQLDSHPLARAEPKSGPISKMICLIVWFLRFKHIFPGIEPPTKIATTTKS